MLVIFLRASLLYMFILLILRLTGKREVSALQPFDLLITLTIADIASFAIADVNIPLLYSIVPILAIFLVQRLMAYLSLKSGKLRLALCGSHTMKKCWRTALPVCWEGIPPVRHWSFPN